MVQLIQTSLVLIYYVKVLADKLWTESTQEYRLALCSGTVFSICHYFLTLFNSVRT